MILRFDKRFKNDKYEILFNTKTGLEITQGINGNADPFVLQMASLLDIGVMGTCKHKCKFCYQGHVNKPNMKLDDFKAIIDEVAFHVNQVALGGRGDPNHHENFKEIIEYCRSKNIVPNYTTSGIGLTDEQVKISKLCGAVAVSDYGQPFTYEALSKLINAGIKTNIHQIFSTESYDRCCNIVLGINPNDWQNFDVSKLNAVIFLLFKPHGAGKLIPEMIPTEEDLKQFASNIFTPKSKFKVGMDSCLVNHVLKYASPTAIQRASVDTCEASRMSAYITPDMKFMPCSFADEKKWAIPIENGLQQIWDYSTQFNKFREVLLKKGDCCPLGL
jgi:MoaA/NifB/PqqE/SkfB family radical SAM enzyme